MNEKILKKMLVVFIFALPISSATKDDTRTLKACSSIINNILTKVCSANDKLDTINCSSGGVVDPSLNDNVDMLLANDIVQNSCIDVVKVGINDLNNDANQILNSWISILENQNNYLSSNDVIELSCLEQIFDTEVSTVVPKINQNVLDAILAKNTISLNDSIQNSCLEIIRGSLTDRFGPILYNVIDALPELFSLLQTGVNKNLDNEYATYNTLSIIDLVDDFQLNQLIAINTNVKTAINEINENEDYLNVAAQQDIKQNSLLDIVQSHVDGGLACADQIKTVTNPAIISSIDVVVADFNAVQGSLIDITDKVTIQASLLESLVDNLIP